MAHPQALVSAIRPGYRPATTPIRQLLALRAACSNERFESHVCTGFGDDLVHRHRSPLREVYLRRPARSWRRGDCAIRYGTARSAPAPRSSPNRCPITLVTQRERRVLRCVVAGTRPSVPVREKYRNWASRSNHRLAHPAPQLQPAPRAPRCRSTAARPPSPRRLRRSPPRASTGRSRAAAAPGGAAPWVALGVCLFLSGAPQRQQRRRRRQQQYAATWAAADVHAHGVGESRECQYVHVVRVCK